MGCRQDNRPASAPSRPHRFRAVSTAQVAPKSGGQRSLRNSRAGTHTRARAAPKAGGKSGAHDAPRTRTTAIPMRERIRHTRGPAQLGWATRSLCRQMRSRASLQPNACVCCEATKRVVLARSAWSRSSQNALTTAARSRKETPTPATTSPPAGLARLAQTVLSHTNVGRSLLRRKQGAQPRRGCWSCKSPNPGISADGDASEDRRLCDCTGLALTGSGHDS